MLLHYGVDVAVISGRELAAVASRMRDLGVDKVYLGFRDKPAALKELLQTYQIAATQVAYLGDDLPDLSDLSDLSIISQVQLACAVADAHPEVLYVSGLYTFGRGRTKCG